MVETDKLLYLDLHKTGCSHIRRVLQTVVGGRLVGKHNRPDGMPTDRFIVGSVRNPWDWYVSLWAFGCSGQGAVHGRVTRRFTPWYYRTGLTASMFQQRWRPGPNLRTIYSDVRKPVARWRRTYADVLDPERFRDWLRLLLSPPRRFDVGEGFAFSRMSEYAGLMTYRYVKLFSRNISPLFSGDCPANPQELWEFDARENALHATIKTEDLEAGLLSALRNAGYDLCAAQIHEIAAASSQKTNRSDHEDSAYYYDDDTIALVGRREQLIARKYGYVPPDGSTAGRRRST